MFKRSLFIKRIYWIVSAVKWLVLRFIHKLTGKYLIRKKKYAGYYYHDYDEGYLIISEYLKSDKPFAVGRASFVEFSILIKNQTRRLFGINTAIINSKINRFAKDISGTPYDEKSALNKYIEVMEDSIRNVDVVATFSNMPMCDSYLAECFQLRGKKIVVDRTVEPFIGRDGWSRYLKGKRVVVVSPFCKEIRQQFRQHEKIWDDPNVLPDFELITVDSVWFEGDSRDTRFANWFDALEFLYNSVMKNNFDVALLGCGSFGFPLASMIKNGGKQAIHIGGALQIMFGVKGRRWDDYGYYNDYWIRPEVRVTKGDMKMSDNGCYW